MKKKKYINLAIILEKVHIFELVVYALSVIIILFFPNYRIYGAGYIIFIWIIERINNKNCPLTIWEHKFRRKAGEKISERRFVPIILKKYFNIEISSKVIDYITNILFIIALFILLYNFLFLKRFF